MRFALLGNHPDGLGLAEALAASGRHQVAVYTDDHPRLRSLPGARRVGDVEEILADPSVDAVIVAGRPGERPAQLRRALQSERHVLCVHPAGDGPEIAYEAAMIRDDVRRVLLPVLIEALHPGVRRLAEFIRRGKEAEESSPVGNFLLLEVERSGVTAVDHKATFPGWDVLRALGGEVAELSALAAGEEAGDDEPVLLTGHFERGGLFQVTLLPPGGESRCRLSIVGARGRAELLFPVGPDGPAFLEWRDAAGERHEEYRESQDLWPKLVAEFEDAVTIADMRATVAAMQVPALTEAHEEGLAARPEWISWQEEVRALELDDAARRSLSRRRTSLLEYPEATEEVGFKGTMTLVGCAVLWGVLLLLIVSAWLPSLGWAIVPLLVGFLALQLLRYALRGKP